MSTIHRIGDQIYISEWSGNERRFTRLSSSGAISINASEYASGVSHLKSLFGYQRQSDQAHRFREYRKVNTFDYSPFAVIKTDGETFMSIEALEHDDNVYPAGKRVFGYSKERLADWRSAFEYLRPYRGRWGTNWKNPAPKIYDYKQLLNKKEQQNEQ